MRSGSCQPQVRSEATSARVAASPCTSPSRGPTRERTSTMRRTFLSAATLAVSALALTQALPANADGIGVSDPKDLGHGVDLRSVEVEHKAANIVVTTTHTDLRPSYRTGSSGCGVPRHRPRRPRPGVPLRRRLLRRHRLQPARGRRLLDTSSARARRGLLPDAGRLRHRPGPHADLPRGARVAGARSASPSASPARARTAATPPRTGSASRAASPTGSRSRPSGRRCYLISRTSCGHPHPSAILPAHIFAVSRSGTSTIVIPPRYSVVSA